MQNICGNVFRVSGGTCVFAPEKKSANRPEKGPNTSDLGDPGKPRPTRKDSKHIRKDSKHI